MWLKVKSVNPFATRPFAATGYELRGGGPIGAGAGCHAPDC